MKFADHMVETLGMLGHWLDEISNRPTWNTKFKSFHGNYVLLHLFLTCHQEPGVVRKGKSTYTRARVKPATFCCLGKCSTSKLPWTQFPNITDVSAHVALRKPLFFCILFRGAVPFLYNVIVEANPMVKTRLVALCRQNSGSCSTGCLPS